MGYQVILASEAQDALGQLAQPVRDRLLKRLRWFVNNFDSLQHESLSGEFSHYYRYRIGDYRVLYTFSKTERTITIRLIGHRKNIYKPK